MPDTYQSRFENFVMSENGLDHLNPREREAIAEDVSHSQYEQRFYALGQTNTGRRLFIVFTIRASKIRIISARDMSRKERKAYEKSAS